MTIKQISLLSLLFIANLNAIMPDEVLGVAHGRYARALDDFNKCLSSNGRCLKETKIYEEKKEQFSTIVSPVKKYLQETIEQGQKSEEELGLQSLLPTFLSQRKKELQPILRNVKAAQRLKEKIEIFEKTPQKDTSISFVSDELYKIIQEEDATQQFSWNLNNAVPRGYDHPFMRDY